jgi:DNA-directed RNA polymerase subunit RPC12/RpoP
LGIFDEQAGPISVYFKGMDQETANKIALKTMVGALALSQQVDEGESIIPIQEENKAAFVYYFSIADENARGGVRIGTLSFVVSKENSDMLYRLAPILAENSKRIVGDVRKYYVYRQPVPQVLMDSVDSILSVQDLRIFPYLYFKENLIRVYLNDENSFHNLVLEKTSNISYGEKILEKEIDIVGRDKNQNIVWVLISSNFLKMNNYERENLLNYVNKLRENSSSLMIVFVLNELGLREDGKIDEKTIERTFKITRTTQLELKEFDLYGMDNAGNIIWALLATNFLPLEEYEIAELNDKIYRLKKAKPSIEALFILAEIHRATKEYKTLESKQIAYICMNCKKIKMFPEPQVEKMKTVKCPFCGKKMKLLKVS